MDPVEHGRAAAVLDGVVKERGDRLGLVSSVFQDEPGNDHQMRDVGDLGAETPLPAVHLVGERGSGEEPVGQRWWGWQRDDRQSVVPPRTMPRRADPDLTR